MQRYKINPIGSIRIANNIIIGFKLFLFANNPYDKL